MAKRTQRTSPAYPRVCLSQHEPMRPKGRELFNGRRSEDVNREMADALDGRCLLAFSGGKDAIAAWIELLNYFPPDGIVPVYRYLIPKLSFVDDALDYYEAIFGTRIVRVPHENFAKAMVDGVWQTRRSAKILDDVQFGTWTQKAMLDGIADDVGLGDDYYTAVGVRAGDSVHRMSACMKYGPINRKKRSWWPIFDWTKQRLVDTLVRANVKLPVDYAMFGRSFDGLNYEYVSAIRERFPDDYARIVTFFPLIECDLKRHEYRTRWRTRTR